MKKPSKPTPPNEPKAPTQSYDEIWPTSFSVYDETIARILDRVNQKVDNWRDMRPEYQFTNPTLDEITVKLEHDGYTGEDSHIAVKWMQKVTITMTDAEWGAARAKHAKAKAAYEEKLEDYEIKRLQYMTDLADWERETARLSEARDRETLARLKAKYPKA